MVLFRLFARDMALPFRLAPDFPAHSDIDHLLKLSKAKKKEGYDYVVCLLDMDRLNSVPAEMKKIPCL